MFRNLITDTTRRRLVGTAVAIFAVSAVVLYYYRWHIAWTMYYRSALHLDSNVFEAPVRMMPSASWPSEWVECKTGSLSFYLPSDLAETETLSSDHEPMPCFVKNGISVFLHPTEVSSSGDDSILKEAVALHPDGRQLTPPGFTYELYKFNACDFSWGMTSKQARWHVFCAQHRVDAYRESVEFSQLPEIEYVVIAKERQAVLRWHSPEYNLNGTIMFFCSSGPLDFDFVRKVSNSIRVTRE